MSGELRGRRVLFLFSTLSFGGAERQGLLVAEHLLAAGAQVSVWGLAPARDGQLDARCRALGIRPRHVHCPQPQLEARRLAGLARFALLLRAARPDVLLPATHIPNLVASLSWRAGGARLCVWNQRDEGIGLDGSRLQRFAARRCPLFVSNTARGAEVAGSRGYFLVGAGALLNQALISYAQHFLTKRGSTMLQTPFAMNKSLMGKVAQLSDYDETLYKVALGATPGGRNFSADTFFSQFHQHV